MGPRRNRLHRCRISPALSGSPGDIDAGAISSANPRNSRLSRFAASDVSRPLITICAAAGYAALVGAPIASNGRHYIATVLVDSPTPAWSAVKPISATARYRGSGQGRGPQAINVDGAHRPGDLSRHGDR